MTHTPGPWQFNGNWLQPVDGGEMILTYTANDDGLHGTDDDKALIEAAPDLLMALEAAEDALSEHCPGLEYLLDSVISPAIAKARNTPALHVEVL